MKPRLEPTDELLARIAGRFRALGDPTRLKILHTLEHGELCVSDILERVGGSQANVSKHLALLRAAGLVTSRRESLKVLYRVADDTSFDLCRLVCDALERWTEAEQQTLRRGRRRP